jgi:hypothetical protein
MCLRPRPPAPPRLSRLLHLMFSTRREVCDLATSLPPATWSTGPALPAHWHPFAAARSGSKLGRQCRTTFRLHLFRLFRFTV